MTQSLNDAIFSVGANRADHLFGLRKTARRDRQTPRHPQAPGSPFAGGAGRAGHPRRAMPAAGKRDLWGVVALAAGATFASHRPALHARLYRAPVLRVRRTAR